MWSASCHRWPVAFIPISGALARALPPARGGVSPRRKSIPRNRRARGRKNRRAGPRTSARVLRQHYGARARRLVYLAARKLCLR